MLSLKQELKHGTGAILGLVQDDIWLLVNSYILDSLRTSVLSSINSDRRKVVVGHAPVQQLVLHRQMPHLVLKASFEVIVIQLE